MLYNWPIKKPTEIKDYGVMWGDVLQGDTINSSSFAVSNTLSVTVDQTAKTSNTTVIWLSGGAEGDVGVVTNTIITNGGRTFVARVGLKIKAF